jgi:putative transcription factor
MDDWDTVTVIRRRPQQTQPTKPETAVNQARRTGQQVETSKKFGAGTNKVSTPTPNAAKLDQETEDFHVNRVGLEVSKIIQKARLEKGLTQKDLALKINERATTINEYENGSAIPNQGILARMERVLEVKLRGKNIGEKLTFSHGKKEAEASASTSKK